MYGYAFYCIKIFSFFLVRGIDIDVDLWYYNTNRRGERQNTPRRRYNRTVARKPSHSHQKFCPRPRASRSFFLFKELLCFRLLKCTWPAPTRTYVRFIWIKKMTPVGVISLPPTRKCVALCPNAPNGGRLLRGECRATLFSLSLS